MLRVSALSALVVFSFLAGSSSVRGQDLQLLAAERAPTTASTAIRVDSGVWPLDCTRDIPRDGLVLLPAALAAPADGGSLRIALQPVQTDAEPLAGAFDAAPSAASSAFRAWRTREPLLAHTEYRLELRSVDAAGEPRGDTILHFFTTGEQLLTPLAFSGRPALRVVASDQAAEAGAELVLVRFSVPPLVGGLSQRPLQLRAELQAVEARGPARERTTEHDATPARTRVDLAVTPGQSFGFELEARLGEQASRRCVAISARDDLGQELALDPQLCFELPGRSQTADDESAADAAPDVAADGSSAPHALSLASEGAQAEALAQRDLASAGEGCSLSEGDPSPDLSWLLALLPLLMRRRPALLVARRS